MIMKIREILFAFIALVLIMSSCSTDKPEDLKHIPDDASFVFTMNPSELLNKSGTEEFTATELYKKITERTSYDSIDRDYDRVMEFDYIFQNPKESGIDFEKQFFVYGVSNRNGWYRALAINFGISDSKKFVAMLKKATEENMDSLEFVETEEYNYLISNKMDNRKIIAWNNSTAIIYSITKGYRGKDLLIERAEGLINLKLSNSIATNKSFVEFYENRKDINIWFNSDFVLNSIPNQFKTVVATQLPINPKGIEYYYYVSFDKGRVIAESQLILPEELKDLIEEYKIIKDDFDNDILKYIPNESFANFSVAVNAHELYRMIKDLYKERQVNIDGVESMAEVSMDIDIERIFSAINGEVVFNIHHIEVKKDSAGCGSPVDVKASLLLKLDNDELYKGFLKIFEDNEKEMIDGYYSILDDSSRLYASMVNNIMLITNDKEVIINFVAEKALSKSLKDSDIAKYLENYALFAQLNLDYSEYDSQIQEYYNERYFSYDKAGMKNKLKEIRIEPTDSYHSRIIIEFKDKERNSLEVMLN